MQIYRQFPPAAHFSPASCNQLSARGVLVLSAAGAYDRIFLWSLEFTLAGLIPALLLPRIRSAASGEKV